VLFIFSREELKRAVIPHETLLYDTGVYWYRDYWSSRLKLNRNIATEDFTIDQEKDVLTPELGLSEGPSGKYEVRWSEGQFPNLVNPFELAQRLEPNRISLVLKKPGLRDEAPDPNYNMKPEQIKDVVAEPITASQAQAKLWRNIFLRIIVPAIILLIVEWILLSYITTIIPQLARFSVTIIIVTLAAFIYTSLVLFVKVGISEKTRAVIGAKATIYFYNGQHPEKYHYKYSKDKPDWLESKAYWVFRYLYVWSFELALEKGLPVVRATKDIERLDVWCDAQTGQIEWIVSDYHWRELWYKPSPTLTAINIWLPANFHTPKPLTISTEGKGTLLDLYRKDHPLAKEWLTTIEKYKLSHTTYFEEKSGKKKKRGRIFNNLLSSEMSALWWEKWRYPLGANNDIYKNHEIATATDQPKPPEPAPKLAPTPMATINPAIVQTAVYVAKPKNNIKMHPGTIFQFKVPAKSTTKPATAKARAAVTSSITDPKRTRTVLYAEVAAVAISLTALGVYLSKKKKTTKIT
jgi:hypothetical protein